MQQLKKQSGICQLGQLGQPMVEEVSHIRTSCTIPIFWINILQGSAATRFRCGEIFKHFNALLNQLRHLSHLFHNQSDFCRTN